MLGGAAAILLHRGPEVAQLDVVAATRPVPGVVRAWVARHGQPPFTVPAAAMVSAYAPITGGHVFAYSVYTVNGRRCEVTYVAQPDSLRPVDPSAGISATCLPVTPHGPTGLSLGMDPHAHAIVLFGTTPAAADRLRITTDHSTHVFAIPHVAVASQPGREAVILDLTPFAAVNRATLLDGRRVVDEAVWSP